MTHELKKIFEGAIFAKHNGLKTVLATVVALDGSSYRKPGVRMLIMENGKMIGAVSGGCVEKEIVSQTETVFKTGVSKMMTYDGRYRLGCEGILYILIESFQPNEALTQSFYKGIKARSSFKIASYFKKKEGIIPDIGSLITLEDTTYSFSGQVNGFNKATDSSLSVFTQKMPPCFKLIIMGAEHDAVQLCQYASLTGWEVTIISTPTDSKTLSNFPEADEFLTISPEEMDIRFIDNQTAVILMTHNFAQDLRHLVALSKTVTAYIGLLGPVRRRDDLLSQLMEYCPNVKDEFLDCIHGQSGLNIGSVTPQEIAISIISEILAVIRNQVPMSLKKKVGRIHAPWSKKE